MTLFSFLRLKFNGLGDESSSLGCLVWLISNGYNIFFVFLNRSRRRHQVLQKRKKSEKFLTIFFWTVYFCMLHHLEPDFVMRFKHSTVSLNYSLRILGCKTTLIWVSFFYRPTENIFGVLFSWNSILLYKKKDILSKFETFLYEDTDFHCTNTTSFKHDFQSLAAYYFAGFLCIHRPFCPLQDVAVMFKYQCFVSQAHIWTNSRMSS